jgi:putative DNA primase/helicase
VPPDFAARVVAETERLALRTDPEDGAQSEPLRLMTPAEKADRRRRGDADLDRQITKDASAREAAIQVDPVLRAQMEELFPAWEGVDKERERLGYTAPDLTPLAVLPPPSDPMAVAREFVRARFSRNDGDLLLRHWRGGWWTWRGSHWCEREERAIRELAYRFTEHAVYATAKGPEGWEPNRNKIANLLEALAAICYLDETVNQPAWTDGRTGGLVVATLNCLLDLKRRKPLPHSPHFFNVTAVPFEYDPAAPEPSAWLTFLAELWPVDPASIAALQEFMGYVVSGRLDLHKILLIVGPTRGGKGTIARILGKLVGRENVCGPTLSSLSYDFGLAPLLGKSLAVISDARLDAQRDASVVVERLLAISGEDTITVNRKYKDQWTGKLPTRFLVISNELPRLGDASGTIANRFIVLLLQESWLGREDLGLEDRLSAELPGILNWALEGLDRLGANGRFTRPLSTDEAIVTLQDLASPVAAFVREQCRPGATFEVLVKVFYGAWKEWAEANGNRPGNTQTFGRNLRAVLPGLRQVRPREGMSASASTGASASATPAQPTVRRTADHRGPAIRTAPRMPLVRSGPRSTAM